MNFREDIEAALKTLKDGSVILYPTDTIWGLGCDPSNPLAINKIYDIKSRALTKSLIIIVNSIDMVERYVREVPESAYQLVSVADTPITIIYPEGKNLAEGVCSSDGSVAIRICNDEFCQELITRFRKPIVSTSANKSGDPSPAGFADVKSEIIDAAGYVVKYRQNERGTAKASPIIKINADNTIKIIRS